MNALRRFKASGVIRWLPGLIISAVAIWLLINFSNWQEVVGALSKVNLLRIAPAIVFYLIGIGLRALTWLVLLQNKVLYGRVFITLNEGYLLNNIFPFRLGEIGRALLLGQATGISVFFVLSTIVIERTYDLAIAAGMLLATVPYVFQVDAGQSIALMVMIVVMIGLASMFVLARNRQKIRKKIESYNTSFFSSGRLLNWLDSLLDGLGIFVRFDQFSLSIFIILISWFFGALEIYYLITSFGIEAQFWWAGFVIGVISLGIALPSAPAGLGVYELAMVGALSLLGVPSSQALAIGLIAHMIHIVATGIFGAYGIFQDGENFAGLYRRLINLRTA